MPDNEPITAGDVVAEFRILAAEHRDLIPMIVIYRPTTADMPGLWLAKLWASLPEPHIISATITAATLEDLRCGIPPEACRLYRSASDDPVIEETWLL